MDTLKRQQFITVLWLQDWFASAWKQERGFRRLEENKDKFPWGGLEDRQLTGWHPQRLWQRRQTNTLGPAETESCMNCLRRRLPQSKQLHSPGGESMWTATLCFGEIIHRARERMTNASSLRLQLWSHKLSKLRNSQSLEYSPNTNK